jgi:hypothetical protein
MSYESELIRALVGPLTGFIPFSLAFYKNRMGLGFAALMLGLFAGKFGGMWASIGLSVLFTLFLIFKVQPKNPEEKG